MIASVWAWLWSLFTVISMLALGPEWLGLVPASAQDIEDGIIGAVLFVIMSGTAWLAVYALRASDVPATLPAYRLPPSHIRVEQSHRLPRPGSAARTPMRRLLEAEGALVKLLRQLSDVQREPAEHAWHVATNTATSLRAVASRIEAVELAAEQASPDKRATLEDAAGSLQRKLDQGIDAYRDLIAAAGLVLAGTPVAASTELIEATESLAGLAEALRELAPPDA